MVDELKLPRSVVQALNSLVSECLEAGRLGSYNAANIARRNLEKELTAWNTRADTGRLSELEAENRRMRWALDYFKRIADERERTPAGELVVVSIESCRDARAALEAQS